MRIQQEVEELQSIISGLTTKFIRLTDRVHSLEVKIGNTNIHEQIAKLDTKIRAAIALYDTNDHHLKILEAKFDRLLKFIESTIILEGQESNFKDYLDGIEKDLQLRGKRE